MGRLRWFSTIRGMGGARDGLRRRSASRTRLRLSSFWRKLAPGAPIAVLGFSLGSGIAAAVMRRVRASRLVLCAGFTSFRAAAHSVGIPVGLAAAGSSAVARGRVAAGLRSADPGGAWGAGSDFSGEDGGGTGGVLRGGDDSGAEFEARGAVLPSAGGILGTDCDVDGGLTGWDSGPILGGVVDAQDFDALVPDAVDSDVG